jgi:hypothetical protein
MGIDGGGVDFFLLSIGIRSRFNDGWMGFVTSWVISRICY